MSGYCKIGFRANMKNLCIKDDTVCHKEKCNYWIELENYIKKGMLHATEKDLDKLDK